MIAFDGVMEMLADAPSGSPSWATDSPAVAIRDFLAEHPELEVDPYCNRVTVPYCPGESLPRKEV